MTNHPHRSARVPAGTSLYVVTTPIRFDPSEPWQEDSTTIRAFNSAQAIQAARSRLVRLGYETGLSVTAKALGS